MGGGDGDDIDAAFHKRTDMIEDSLTIEFSDMLTPAMIEKLITKNPRWDFTTKMVKIDFEELGQKWLHELKSYVRLFQRAPEQVKPDTPDERTK